MNASIVTALRSLYQRNPDARLMFDWTASLTRDATETSIDRMMAKLRLSRSAAVSLARELEEAGCGEFIVGRHGSLSRFKWAYSRVSLGRVAAGETDELEDPYEPITTEEDDSTSPEGRGNRHLTIQEAKILLAESLGLEPSQIAIEIRA